MLCEPEDHFVTHEHAEVLLQLKLEMEVSIKYFTRGAGGMTCLRLGETASDGHNGTREYPLDGNWPHQGLNVGSEPERNSLAVVEKWVR